MPTDMTNVVELPEKKKLIHKILDVYMPKTPEGRQEYLMSHMYVYGDYKTENLCKDIL